MGNFNDILFVFGGTVLFILGLFIGFVINHEREHKKEIQKANNLKKKNMNYFEFLTKVIDEGIAAAKADYTEESDKERLEGSIAGFEACRNKLPEELVKVWQEATDKMNYAFGEQKENYWWFRCFQLEVEWVCNVVSAMLVNEGQDPLLSWLPTANGGMKAASIIGVNQNA